MRSLHLGFIRVLCHSYTSGLLLSLTHLKSSYLSFRWFFFWSETLISFIAAVACKQLQGRHAVRYF
ncbi:hypothetical protein BKA61DRAFT_618802 [Leptodontidium sp. MPI-SDFR-AT-0119]|nr:hypothetical protein BKA61DRAFT_618802 [Leptodontidium sp. MPI-SDFR-AT-0119]